MPAPIYLVKVGMSMTEGVIDEWYVADGAHVDAGDPLYRLETEKVNLDVDAEASGTVKHTVAEGVTLQPGDVIGYVYAAGESIPEHVPASAPAAVTRLDTARAAAGGAEPVAKEPGNRVLASPAARRLAAELRVDLAAVTGTGPGGRIVEADVRSAASAAATAQKATPSSPIARKRARELNVDLADVNGSGPGGRITKEDVEAAAARTQPAPRPEAPAEAAADAAAETPAAAAPADQASPGDRSIPVRGMRRTIAVRMHQSLQSMAQLTMDMDVAMDAAVELRRELIAAWEDRGVRPTYSDLVIRAAALALENHPIMNASFDDTAITLHGEINVGLAVALDDGLIAPVIRHANRRSLSDIAMEAARLAAAARDGSLSLDDVQGGTFTVSPLGMFGVDSFTPIVNAPQVGILGVNRIRDEVAWRDERPAREQRMKLSLTWDHRALDGAPAARFLGAVRDLLQAPLRLLR